jgi:Mg-chelatase subunit ChlD
MRTSTFGALACLFFASTAHAGSCPKVMIVLDISASMDSTPSGTFSGPTKLDIAKKAITRLLSRYGTRMPFGLETFSNSLSDCYDGIDILVPPDDGTAAEIASRVNALTTNGSTNTGEGIKTAANDPSMANDGSRPASYILLITDGEPNCPDPDTAMEPAYTVSEIQKAADMGIKTFVIGFGQLPSSAQKAMNMMADAGGEPCMTTSCGTKHFYSAESDTALNDAIDAVSQQIVGEVGGQCDDSCYANPCPNPSDVCVQAKCVRNPCATLDGTCAPGEYCYTDGTSPGVCIHACPGPCPKGQSCVMGTCQVDPCATASCVIGNVCVNGACVADPCAAKSCDSHYICIDGQCADDACHYVTCPANTGCLAGTGQCIGTAPLNGSTTGGRGSGKACSYGDAGGGFPALAPLFVLIMLALRERRRRIS